MREEIAPRPCESSLAVPVAMTGRMRGGMQSPACGRPLDGRDRLLLGLAYGGDAGQDTFAVHRAPKAGVLYLRPSRYTERLSEEGKSDVRPAVSLKWVQIESRRLWTLRSRWPVRTGGKKDMETSWE